MPTATIEHAGNDAPHPVWVTPALINATLCVWQPYYTQPLTREDAVAILVAVGRLVDALARG